jgi:hypothetical protein
MQGVPTHAEVPHPHVPSRAPVVAAIAALLVGGAIATGVWWLTDNDVNILPESEPATRVIVTQPVEPGAGTAAKNEAGVAAAVGGLAAAPGAGTAAKNEAGVAAAISGSVAGESGLSVGQRYGTAQYRVDPSTGYATPASPPSSYGYPGPTPDSSPRGPGARTE